MSVAPARRFHEEGLGSRTGLRIGNIRRDDRGNEDLDAFFAESKRVLEWMEASDDEAASESAPSTADQIDQIPEPDDNGWDRRISRVSEWAARSLSSVPRASPVSMISIQGDTNNSHALTPSQEYTQRIQPRSSMAPRAEETMWESTVDISRSDRTFRLSAFAGDASTFTSSSSTPASTHGSARSHQSSFERELHLQRTSQPPAPLAPQALTRTQESPHIQPVTWHNDVTLPSASTPLVSSLPARYSMSRGSSTAADMSRVPDTDMPSFLRPDASILSGQSQRRRPSHLLPSSSSSVPLSPASSHHADAAHPSSWDVASQVSASIPELDAIHDVPDDFGTKQDAGQEFAQNYFDLGYGTVGTDLDAQLSSNLDAPLNTLEPVDNIPNGGIIDDVVERGVDRNDNVPVQPILPKKRGRGRPRKDESMPPPRGRPGRPPGRQKPAQKIVERIYDPPSWQLENPDGLRRGKRHRIAPLDWWRGERALYGKPDEPAEQEEGPEGLVAPVLKKVIRVPRAPGEGTFSGMRRFRAKPAGYAHPGRPVGSKNFVPRLTPVDESENETGVDDEDTRLIVRNPEDGWDDNTDPYGRVVDADLNAEVTMRIACTAAGIRPRPAFNQQFSYEKIFGISDFMAAGVLVIPRGGEKPTKPSKDNNYVRVRK